MLHNFHQALLEHGALMRRMFKAFFQLNGFKLVLVRQLLEPFLFAHQRGTTLEHLSYFPLQLLKGGVFHKKTGRKNERIYILHTIFTVNLYS